MEDRIADLVLDMFDGLPPKLKPAQDRSGFSHWVPLSGIVMSSSLIGSDESMECLALATGAKCLPANTVPLVKGCVLHDSHAEILGIRALNHFLLKESRRMILNRELKSPYLRWRQEHERSELRGLQPLTIRDEIKLHMYCSEAPCGDASMELTMCEQAAATPWPVARNLAADDSKLKGRGYFSELGIVRRKPARADSQPTLSKSCSDKLALKQGTSLLSGLSSVLISPENAYLETLVLPQSRYNTLSIERAFSPKGRLNLLSGRVWNGGYAFRPFKTKSTCREYRLSQSSIRRDSSYPKVSNISAIWTPDLQEVLINGVQQGRKQSDLRGASVLSRSKMAPLALSSAVLLNPISQWTSHSLTYSEFKALKILHARRVVKEDMICSGLCGWVRNWSDDFSIIQ